MCLSSLSLGSRPADCHSKQGDRVTSVRRHQRTNHPPDSRRTRSRQGWNRTRRLQRGGFSILGAVLLLAIFSVATGLFQIRRAVHEFTQRQVNFDRETGRAALELRAALKTLSASYSRMDFYRSVTLAACPLVPTPLCPEALTAFRAAASVEGSIQQLVRLHWHSQTALWTSGTGVRNFYPEFNFPIATGTERDLLRSWSSEFELLSSRTYDFWISWRNAESKARLRKSHEEWNVAWVQ